MRPTLSLLALPLLAWTSPRPAFGQEGVRFEYAAPAGCPSQAEFLSRVRERLLDASQGDLPAERRALVVRVHVEPARRAARVEFQEAGGARIERAVQGDDCDELVSGVALITALAFGSRTKDGDGANAMAASAEATASDAPAQPDAAQPPEDAASPGPPQPGDPAKPAKLAPMAAPPKTRTESRRARANRKSSRLPQSAARSRANAVEPAPDAFDAEERPEDAPPLDGTPARRGLGWDAGAGGWISSWLSPGRTLGADAFARVGERGSGWSARVSVGYGAGATTQVDDREADFAFLGGRVEGCPVGLAFARSARVEPCLALELGQLRGTGREDSALRVGTDESVFWAAAVLVGRVRTVIARRIVVEAQGELGIPVTSHEFVFEDPQTRVFTAPALGAGGRIGVGVPFL